MLPQTKKLHKTVHCAAMPIYGRIAPAMRPREKILLLTPPFVQLNTPYPATTQLVGWLTSLGVSAFQRDLSIEVALEVLRTYGEQPLTDEVIAFLQDRAPDNAETLAEPGYLPEGPAFDSLAPEGTGLTRADVRDCPTL